MPIRCPVCKADNATGPDCRRCKADLEMLVALDQQRELLLARSRNAFGADDIAGALDAALAADALRRGEDTQRWLAALQLLTKNFGEAWRLYQAMVTHA